MKKKEPIVKGIAKVPVVMQLEALECGAAALTMILAYYNKWIPLEQVRKDCGVSRDGSSAKNVLKAARNYGLEAHGYRFELESLMEEATFPCIIHWNFNHFVVLDGFKGKYAYINDPARGEVKVPLKEFDEAFTGVAILFEPTEEFVASGHKKTTFEYIKERSKGLGALVAFVVLTSIISSLMGVISPGFNRIFYDRFLVGKNMEWVPYFLGGFIVFSIVQVFVNWLVTINNLKINGKLSVVGTTSFMWKVLRLPMEFFSQRMVGDVLTRQTSNTNIANTIVNTFAPLILNFGMMAFYLIVMIRYNPLLTAIALVSTVTNIVISRVVSKKRMNATRIQMRDSGKLAATTVAGIEMIETIKASGSEDGFFERWAGYQAGANNGSVQFQSETNLWSLIPSVVSTITSEVILFIGMYLTMKGEFTLGMITAFQGYLAGFLAPAGTLISASQTIQEMETEIERIDDVMNYPNDFVFDAKKAENDEEFTKLSGNVEIKNITFGYSRLSEPLIKDFSLTLKPGSRVAFVGTSGCGKSTLSKLISGLEEPWSGEILFDGKPIKDIDRAVFTGSLAVVDQDIIMFEDSIKNNIKMWDKSIEDFEVVLACRDAQIHEDIMQREGGYDYQLTEGGKDFSGGQKQRLEIARVLSQDPTICILDEATSALDAKTEYETIEAIKARGITCIVVAHRLSTIKDCDEIIVLDNGVVVERGTHSELLKLNGYYKQLISSD